MDGKKKIAHLDTNVISGRISHMMLEAINNIIITGEYVSMTDYLRDLIRKDLKSRGIEF